MSLFRLVIWVVLGLFLIAFSLSNRSIVALTIFPFPYVVEMPLFAPVFAAFLLGIIIGSLLLLRHRIKNAMEMRVYKKQVSDMKKEVAAVTAKEISAELSLKVEKNVI